jgi:hypothetical protein
MSFDSPARRGVTGAVSETIDLLIGAEAIAEFLYGDRTQTRDVYRNVLGLPLFKHGAKIAATKSGLIQEIRSREKAAREERAAAVADGKSAAAARRKGKAVG